MTLNPAYTLRHISHPLHRVVASLKFDVALCPSLRLSMLREARTRLKP